MQDPQTGNMIPIDPENKEYFKSTIGINPNDPEGFDSQKIAMEAEKRGYCVLSIGEYVDIKGGEFLIETLGKKEIMFKCPANVFDLKIKLGDQVTIKNGNFRIEHFGPRFLKVCGLPGNHVFDQQIIDDARKAHIKDMQKQNKAKKDDVKR